MMTTTTTTMRITTSCDASWSQTGGWSGAGDAGENCHLDDCAAAVCGGGDGDGS